MKILLSLLSNFWSRAIRTKAHAASLTLHENDAVHVQLTSGTSSSNREEERPPEPITGFGSRAGTMNPMHRVWVASFADIYQPGV